jgi:hypothetical protein
MSVSESCACGASFSAERDDESAESTPEIDCLADCTFIFPESSAA